MDLQQCRNCYTLLHAVSIGRAEALRTDSRGPSLRQPPQTALIPATTPSHMARLPDIALDPRILSSPPLLHRTIALALVVVFHFALNSLSAHPLLICAASCCRRVPAILPKHSSTTQRAALQCIHDNRTRHHVAQRSGTYSVILTSIACS
jgi:hypothetical protein